MMPDGSWIRIENLSYILDQFRPKIYHPDDPRYIPMWRELKKRCIEGIWVPQFNGVRFVPGRLGFFGVFARFEDWTEEGERIYGIPKVRDLEWHRAYYRTEMDGFSGFNNDDKYSSDSAIFEASATSKKNLNEKRWLQLFNKNGQFKEYISPRENIFMIHDDIGVDRGRPLYYESAKNHTELGARGGGKSFWSALGEALCDICMDGAKSFKDPIITRAIIEITCGGGGKSSEMLEKLEEGMRCLADPKCPELGVWEYGKDDIEPCPFWKKMSGTLSSNNKENPWINLDEFKRGGRWIKEGNKDRVYNTQYTPNSKAGAQKSAGGRRTYILHEEFGLNTEILSAWGSNEGMITDSGDKKAGQKAIGTSGNMDTIIGAKAIMTSPKEFSCLTFTYPDEEGEFGWFLPTYMVDMNFKNDDGNTDIELAKEKALKKREIKAQAKHPSVYLEHIMNNPIKIDDMWVQGSGNLLPVLEAEAREKELMKNNLYREIGTHIELFWDEHGEHGIGYKVLNEEALNKRQIQPFYEWPLEPERISKEAVFTMYIHPSKLYVGGVIPNDAVFCVHDPYVSDEMELGGSLGGTYFIVNPKYIPHGLPGNMLAASYIGKASRGVDDYNRVLELGMAFYGNPQHGLWYESNRGDKLRSYFLRKRKLNLLCLQPQFEQGQFIYRRNVTHTGYKVGSRDSRVMLLDSLSDWLLEETELTIDGESTIKRNIERIPDIFLLRQIKQYNLKQNFDAVDAMCGISLALGEQRHRVEAKVRSTGFELFSNYFKKSYGNYRTSYI